MDGEKETKVEELDPKETLRQKVLALNDDASPLLLVEVDNESK